MKADIVVESKINETPRVEQVRGLFDLAPDKSNRISSGNEITGAIRRQRRWSNPRLPPGPQSEPGEPSCVSGRVGAPSLALSTRSPTRPDSPGTKYFFVWGLTKRLTPTRSGHPEHVGHSLAQLTASSVLHLLIALRQAEDGRHGKC